MSPSQPCNPLVTLSTPTASPWTTRENTRPARWRGKDQPAFSIAAVDQEDAARRSSILLSAFGLLDAAARLDSFDREIVVGVGVARSGLLRARRFAALVVTLPGHLDEAVDFGCERV